MTTSQLTLTHNGTSYNAVPGTIVRTSLGFHVHHGRMVAELGIDLPDSGYINIGDRVLDEKVAGTPDAEGSAYGLDYVMSILRAAGAGTWEALKGSRVLVLLPHGVDELGQQALGLARADGANTFIFQEHADSWKAREF